MLKVTLSQLTVAGALDKSYRLQVSVVKMGAGMSGHQTMPWIGQLLFWGRPETRSKTRQSWRSMAESSRHMPLQLERLGPRLCLQQTW